MGRITFVSRVIWYPLRQPTPFDFVHRPRAHIIHVFLLDCCILRLRWTLSGGQPCRSLAWFVGHVAHICSWSGSYLDKERESCILLYPRTHERAFVKCRARLPPQRSQSRMFSLHYSGRPPTTNKVVLLFARILRRIRDEVPPTTILRKPRCMMKTLFSKSKWKLHHGRRLHCASASSVSAPSYANPEYNDFGIVETRQSRSHTCSTSGKSVVQVVALAYRQFLG